jgi:tRNA/tmRNA/rRNA uracil-C5-methylase (TrmA/RlmC/RlmD family)
MKTLKQEIKELKTGYEKIFKVDYENEYKKRKIEYIVVRKSKLKGLEIYLYTPTEISYEEIRNNFTEFSLYDQSKIDY